MFLGTNVFAQKNKSNLRIGLLLLFKGHILSDYSVVVKQTNLKPLSVA